MMEIFHASSLKMDQLIHTGHTRIFPGYFYHILINIISLDIRLH